jgi:hypothetical protein
MFSRTHTLATPRIIKKRRRRRIIRVSVTLVSIIVLVIATIVIARLKQFQIATIEVTGTQVIDPAAIEKVADTVLDGSYAWVIPKRTVFFVPTGMIHDAILKAWPRIASIDIERTSLTDLHITIDEHQAAYLWCTPRAEIFGEYPSAQAIASSTRSQADVASVAITDLARSVMLDPCYLTNASGLAFAVAPRFSPGVYLTLFGQPAAFEATSTVATSTDGVGLASPTGDDSAIVSHIYAEPAIWSHAIAFVGGLKAMHLSPLYLVPISGAEQQYAVYLSGGERIFFTADNSVVSELGILKGLLDKHYFSFGMGGAAGTASSTSASVSSFTSAAVSSIAAHLDYVDLRFGTAVYYRLMK